MNPILIKKQSPKISKYGGSYIRTQWRGIPNNEIYILDVYEHHYAAKRFLPYLKLQNILSNLDVIEKNGKKYISGYSEFKFLKNKLDG